LISFSLLIGNVAAVKYKDDCYGGDNHKVTWTKTLYEKYFDKTVKMNGKTYERYINVYEYKMGPCFHKSHFATPAMAKVNKDGYARQFISGSRNGKMEYSYKLVTTKTENVRIGSNTKFGSKPYIKLDKTSTKNFVITHTMKFTKKDFSIHEDPFTGYLNVKSKNPKIKIKSIDVMQGNGYKGFKWKTHKINSNKKTITLGKNTLANLYENGVVNPLIYRIKY
jgi:hypothetical protein